MIRSTEPEEYYLYFPPAPGKLLVKTGITFDPELDGDLWAERIGEEVVLEVLSTPLPLGIATCIAAGIQTAEPEKRREHLKKRIRLLKKSKLAPRDLRPESFLQARSGSFRFSKLEVFRDPLLQILGGKLLYYGELRRGLESARDRGPILNTLLQYLWISGKLLRFPAVAIRLRRGRPVCECLRCGRREGLSVDHAPPGSRWPRIFCPHCRGQQEARLDCGLYALRPTGLFDRTHFLPRFRGRGVRFIGIPPVWIRGKQNKEGVLAPFLRRRSERVIGHLRNGGRILFVTRNGAASDFHQHLCRILYRKGGLSPGTVRLYRGRGERLLGRAVVAGWRKVSRIFRGFDRTIVSWPLSGKVGETVLKRTLIPGGELDMVWIRPQSSDRGRPEISRRRNIAAGIGDLLSFLSRERSCPLCSRDFQEQIQGLCPECRAEISFIHPPYCYRCGRGLGPQRQGWRSNGPHRSGLRLCRECTVNKRQFARVVAAARYRGLLRAAIREFKYRNRRELAAPLAVLLCEAVREKLAGESWEVLLPIPAPRRRRRERGYNQALLLARAAADILPGDLRWRAVRRRRGSSLPQSGLDRSGRRKNIRNAFEVAAPQDIEGCRVLVIDDIMTTGATIDEMAVTLKQGGARRVFGAVLARGS